MILSLSKTDLIDPDRKCSPNIVERAREQTTKRLEHRKRAQTRYANLKVGDLVFVRSRVLSSKDKKISAKLCRQWSGPFEILRSVYPNVYELRDVNENHLHNGTYIIFGELCLTNCIFFILLFSLIFKENQVVSLSTSGG